MLENTFFNLVVKDLGYKQLKLKSLKRLDRYTYIIPSNIYKYTRDANNKRIKQRLFYSYYADKFNSYNHALNFKVVSKFI